MKILKLVQGSPEWKQTRSTHYTASEAPAMMGASKYMSRDQLLKMKATGEEKEIDRFTQQLFDKGHAAEAAIRPHVEKIIGDELFPATGSEKINGLPFLASFDGITMAEDIIFEHKLFNKQLAEDVTNETLSAHYTWQLDQQLLLSGAEKAIFVVSDGTPETMRFMFYYPDQARFASLIAGWLQFKLDLKHYAHAPETVKAESKVIMELPALNIQINGSVTNSNLAVYESSALAFIESINTVLITDEDFATAESTVKFCGEAEKKLDLVKAQALEQTADISVLFRTIDKLKEQMRSKRLTIDKLVKTEKQNIKHSIIKKANDERLKHQAGLNESLGGNYVFIDPDFITALKGKKTIDSLQGAANDEVARCKIEANATADKVRGNIAYYNDNIGDYRFLFHDLAVIIHKDGDDFTLCIDARISAHKEQEKIKLDAEREKIRKEETEKVLKNATKAGEVAKEIIENHVNVGTKGHIDHGSIALNSQKADKKRAKEIETEIKQSIIDNGIGKTTAIKITKLIIERKIKNVTIIQGIIQ